MVERRISTLVAALVVLLIAAVLWDAFVRPLRAPRRTELTARSATDTAPAARPDPAASETTTSQAVQRAATAPPLGPSYMELLSRSETRRRIRASVGYTYLNEVVAASDDSLLHRWDNRILNPVRVHLGPGTAANFQPSFLDAVRSAFERWQQVGAAVQFDLNADTATAEVRFWWKIQFDIERTGQTDLTWDQDGHLVNGVVTLATFDPKGRPMTAEDMRVVALHEVGHLIGLDHSPDSSDIMYPTTKVRDLSPRDVASALLLYQLAPGSLR